MRAPAAVVKKRGRSRIIAYQSALDEMGEVVVADD
jgi:hypothetical protein